MNIVSPRLNMGLPMIAVSPRQPPQPYLRHGCGPQVGILTITQLAFTRLSGRTKARPYDRFVLRNVGCLFLAHK